MPSELTSEDSGIDSKTTSELTAEEAMLYEWVDIRTASFREGVTERTIHNRRESSFYRSCEINGKYHILLPKIQNSTENASVKNHLSTEVIQKSFYNSSEDSENVRYLTEVVQNLRSEVQVLKSEIIEKEVELKITKKDLENLLGHLKEKDAMVIELRERIADSKILVESEKGRADAEKSRADMASNQLMNANAALQRRDTQLPEQPIQVDALKEMQAKIEELQKPWWQKIMK